MQSEHSLAFGKPRTLTSWALIAFFIIWLIFSVSSYFVVNKPFDPALPVTLSAAIASIGFSTGAAGRTLLDLAAALGIVAAALGLGHFEWLRLSEEEGDPLTTLVLSLGLGFGSLGLLVLALGLMGLLSTELFFALLLVCTVLAPRRSVRLLQQLPWPRPPLLIGLFLLLAVGSALALALLPPTSWDALSYHLQGPGLYLQAGQIRPGVDIPALNYPSLFEMLYLLGLAIRGDVAAKLLHFAFSLLLAGMIYTIATRLLRVKSKSGWTTVLFLFATPLVPILSAWAYNDLALAYFAAAALFSFIRWQERGQDHWLRLSGVFSGFMMGLKYTAVITPLFLGVLVIWHYRRDLRRGVGALWRFGLPALLVVLPWLLKNWAFTGNPVYPFLFGGQFWDEFRAAAFGDPGSGIGLDPVALLRLPYDLTLGYADASQEGPVGPFYLIFLPLIVVYGLSRARKNNAPAAGTLLLYAAAGFAFWTAGVIWSRGLWQGRLLLPVLVVLCPILAQIMEELEGLDHPQFSLRRFLGLAMAFVLGLLFLSQSASWLRVNPIAYLSGSETRQEYLQRRLGGHYLAMETINERLPEEATVTFLWEPRSYYCDNDCHPDLILDKWSHLVYRYGTEGQIVERWHEEGITHVLLFQAGLDFVLNAEIPPLTPADVEVLRALQEEHLSPVTTWDNVYTLYEVRG